ncbi:MAG TPA: diguanylate cyclase [Vicinamibacterales bacterium]|nr:diguanylate cyclase [Vicinamibacterales bacterium]
MTDIPRKKPVVLMVDDEEEIREMAKTYFEEVHGHHFIAANSFDAAVAVIHDTPGEIVAFVDIHLRGGKKSGLDLLRYIQDNASHRVVAYAFTGESSLLVEAKALQAGAINVFHKSVDQIDRLVVYAEESLVSRLVRRWAEDDLTGLDNFHAFRRAVKAEMASSRDRQDSHYPAVSSLLFVDADKFKAINDTHGHLAGDMALKEIARGLRGRVRPTDHLCRKGGDEFLVWLSGADEKRAMEVGEELRQDIAAASLRTESGEPIPISVSVGASQIRREDIGDDLDQVLEDLISRANREEMAIKSRR